MFGQNKPFGTGFGSTFGSPSSSTFGQTSTTGFGSSTPAFGSTSVFGSPAVSTPSNVFGGGFGTTTTTASSGLFGNTSSFGSPAFAGAGTSSSLFGSTANQQKPFGSSFSSGTAGGLFGASSTQQTGGLFGQKPTGGGLFGSSTTQGGFGTTQQGQGSYIKFSPVNTGVDTMVKNGVSSQVNTRNQTITLMKEYENKSVEEIRAEDYALGRHKKPAGGAFGPTFGAPASSTPSLFGTATTSAGGGLFGQSKPLFGSTTTTTASSGGLFGQTGGGLFGQNKPAFGTPATSSGFGFGQAQPQTSITGGLFGQNKPAFGGTAGGGLFGATNTPSAGFGSTGTTGFNFGTTTSQSGGLFGAKTAGFGAPTTTSASAFGGFGQATSQPSLFGSSTGGLFGKPTTSVAPFGATTTTTPSFGFGATGGAFGATAQPSGGLFGASKPAFGGFGATAQPATSAPAFGAGTGAFGGFGSSTGAFGAAKPGGLFGTQTTPSAGAFGGFGTGSTFGTGGSFGSGGLFGSSQSQPAFGAPTLTQQPQPAGPAPVNLIGSPYGDSPLFRDLTKRAEKKEELLKPTSLAAQRAYAKPSTLKFKPSIEAASRPLVRRSLVISPQQSRLFDGLPAEGESSGDVPMPSAKKSVKSFRLPLEWKKKNVNSDLSPSMLNGTAPSYLERSRIAEPLSPIVGSTPLRRDIDDYRARREELETSHVSIVERKHESPRESPRQVPRERMSNGHDEREAGDEEEERQVQEQEDANTEPAPPPYPAGIKCARVGYYTIPTPEELEMRVDADGRCIVDGLTIGRTGYGSIYFPDSFDVAGLDLDNIVHIRRKEVAVYPDESVKPPVGEGLNRRAEITLDGCWPVARSGDLINSPQRLESMRYSDILEKNCRKMGATFKDYRCETGSWVFSVKHFSKYGIDDADEEEAFMNETRILVELQARQRLLRLQVKNAAPPVYKAVVPVPISISPVRTLGANDMTTESFSARSVRSDEDKTESESMADAEDITDQEEPTPNVVSKIEQSFSQSFASRSLFADIDREGDNLEQQCIPYIGSENLVPRRISPVTSDSPGLQLFGGAKAIPFPKIRHIPITVREEAEYDPFSKFPADRAVKVRQKLPRIRSEARAKFDGMDSPEEEDKAAGTPDQCAVPICWGPRNVLVHLGKAVKPKFVQLPGLPMPSGEAPELPPSVLVCETVGDTCYNMPSNPNFIAALHESSLLIHLELAVFESEDDPCPHIMSENGEELVERLAENYRLLVDQATAEDVKRCNLEEAAMLWNLLEALFGRLGDDGRKKGRAFDSEHARVYQRRGQVSTWLEATPFTLTVSEELRNDKFFPLYEAVVGQQVLEAASLAKTMGDPILAGMLSAGGAGGAGVKLQLDSWRETGDDTSMSEMLLRVYCLLAKLPMWVTSDGRVIHPLAGVDWKRSLGLILWHYIPPNADLIDAVKTFGERLKATKAGDLKITYPSPKHSKKPDGSFDLAYQLLLLYCDRSVALEPMGAPETFTNDVFDFRMNWLVLETLRALGYTQMSKRSNVDVILGYAAQLDALGLWEWAIFVLQHIPDREQRYLSVQRVMHRNIFMEGDIVREDFWGIKERFLTEKLRLALHVIARTKAYNANSHGRDYEEAALLIDSGNLYLALDIIMEDIAPECLENNEYEKLEQILQKMNRPEIIEEIPHWDMTGEILLEFLRVVKATHGIMGEGPVAFCDFKKLLAAIEYRDWLTVGERRVMDQMCIRLCRCVEDLLDQNAKPHGTLDSLDSSTIAFSTTSETGSTIEALSNFIAVMYDVLESAFPDEWFGGYGASTRMSIAERSVDDEYIADSDDSEDVVGDYYESFATRRDDVSESSTSS